MADLLTSLEALATSANAGIDMMLGRLEDGDVLRNY